jgi:DNA-directed RNA polymerase subunit beta
MVGEPRVPIETDGIDHFGNRRLRTVGELIQNQVGWAWPGWSGWSGADDSPGRPRRSRRRP